MSHEHSYCACFSYSAVHSNTLTTSYQLAYNYVISFELHIFLIYSDLCHLDYLNYFYPMYPADLNAFSQSALCSNDSWLLALLGC